MTSDLGSRRRFPVLGALTDDELDLLLRRAEPVTFQRGEYLFREGDPGDALFLIEEGVGVAERLVDPGAGARKDLAVLPSGSMVGEMALADDSPRSASVRAEIAIRARRLPRAAFLDVTAAHPEVAAKLFRALFAETSRRLRATDEELVAVYEVGRFIAGATEAREVAERTLRSLAARLRARDAMVAMYDAGSNALRIAFALGDRSGKLVGAAIALDDGLAAQAYDQKRPLLVERLLGATEPWESESMILAPLVVRDQAVGLLVLGAPAGGRGYTVEDLSLAAAVSNISAPLVRDAFAARA